MGKSIFWYLVETYPTSTGFPVMLALLLMFCSYILGIKVSEIMSHENYRHFEEQFYWVFWLLIVVSLGAMVLILSLCPSPML